MKITIEYIYKSPGNDGGSPSEIVVQLPRMPSTAEAEQLVRSKLAKMQSLQKITVISESVK